MKIINKCFRFFCRPIMMTGLIISVLVLAGCLPGRFGDEMDSPSSSDNEEPSNELISDYFSSDDAALLPPDIYTPVGLNQGESINIYSEPKLDAPIIGEVPATSTYINSSGEPLQQGNITWILVDHDNTQGWVDSKYLAIRKGEISDDMISLGLAVLDALRRYDYIQLADLVHPDHCLKFSPYSYITEDDLVFCPADLREITSSDKDYTWGRYDGIGDPIKLEFRDYHKFFVYDVHYFRPEMVGFNVKVSAGNAINNINDIYPDGLFIEYYFSGFDPKYGGLDWRSLTLVFVKDNQTWYPVAIVHGEWTI